MSRLADRLVRWGAVATALVSFFAIELTFGLSLGTFYGMAESLNHSDAMAVNVARAVANFCLWAACMAVPASLTAFLLAVALAPTVPRIAQRLTFVCEVEFAFIALAMLTIALFPYTTPLNALKGSIASALDAFLYNAWWTLGLTLLAALLAFLRVRSGIQT